MTESNSPDIHMLEFFRSICSLGSESLLQWESESIPEKTFRLLQRFFTVQRAVFFLREDDEMTIAPIHFFGICSDDLADDLPLYLRAIHKLDSSNSVDLITPGSHRRHPKLFPLIRGNYVEGALLVFMEHRELTDDENNQISLLCRYLVSIFYSCRTMKKLRGHLIDSRRIGERQALLYELSQALVSTHKLDIRLHAILTAVTLEEGLGFNRTILYLVNDDKNALFGKMAIGSETKEEAERIWAAMERDNQLPQDKIRRIVTDDLMPVDPLHQRLLAHRIPLDDSGVFARCVREQQAFRIRSEVERSMLSEEDKYILASDELVCVPIISGAESLGIIIADYGFSKTEITAEKIQFLWMVANILAATIDSTRKFESLVKLNNELRSTREALIRAEKMSAMSDLTSQLAHEIRNPLVAIGGFARQLARKDTAHPEDRQKLEIIYSETRRIEKILDNSLKFTGFNYPQPEVFEINTVVKATLNVLRLLFHEKKMTVEFENRPGKIFIEIDPDHFKQVLHNLFMNSLQAQEEGGWVYVRTSASDGFADIEIRDAGIGVNQRNLDRLFEPYFTTKSGGSGLGLYLVRKMVELNHGAISAIRNADGSLSFKLKFKQKES